MAGSFYDHVDNRYLFMIKEIDDVQKRACQWRSNGVPITEEIPYVAILKHG